MKFNNLVYKLVVDLNSLVCKLVVSLCSIVPQPGLLTEEATESLTEPSVYIHLAVLLYVYLSSKSSISSCFYSGHGGRLGRVQASRVKGREFEPQPSQD